MYKSIRKVVAGAHFPASGPGSARQRQIYTKTGLLKAFPSTWPREAPPAYKSIRKVAAGAHFPASGPGSALQRQIYTETGFPRAFPSRWPREAPPAYKSIRKVAAGAHFPASGPGSARQRQIYTKTGPRRAFPSRWPREAPASVQIYTKSGRWGPFPSTRMRPYPIPRQGCVDYLQNHPRLCHGFMLIHNNRTDRMASDGDVSFKLLTYVCMSVVILVRTPFAFGLR